MLAAWREKLREVDAIACAVDARASAHGASAAAADDTAIAQLMQQLVTYLDDDEPLVAYAALRHLEQRVVVQQQHQHELLLVELLLTMPAAHQWTASSGYRFQLLRALIQKSCAASDGSGSNDDEDGDDDDGISASTSPGAHAGLMVVLNHTTLLQSIAIDILQPKEENSTHPVHSTLVKELLELLTVLAEQLTEMVESIEEEGDKEMAVMERLRDFYELVKTMFRIFTAKMEYASQPTYVSCAVVGFLHQFLRFQITSSRASGGSGTSIKSEWLQWYLDLLIAERSPLTKFALELLHTFEPSEISSQAPFVSSESRFPFLQSWISFASSAAFVLAQGSVDFGHSGSTAVINSEQYHLPDRMKLLAVLSEQDDVMVEVLHILLQLTILVESHRRQDAQSQEGRRFSKSVAWLIEYLEEQLDPDLLFADILRTFGYDHLVLLDLLISSETVMLEYLLRYLRRLGSNWVASRAVLCRQRGSSSQTLDAVLGVLIRLRFEIDKQVAAGMFPYNAVPLLRRLVHVEELYESA